MTAWAVLTRIFSEEIHDRSETQNRIWALELYKQKSNSGDFLGSAVTVKTIKRLYSYYVYIGYLKTVTS